MFRRNFHNQKGESSLFMAMALLVAAGVVVKVTVDRLGDQAKSASRSQEEKWAEDAIETAKKRAEALLNPSELVTPNGQPTFVPGDILVRRNGVGLMTSASRFNLVANAPTADWALLNTAACPAPCLSITVRNAGGTNADRIDNPLTSDAVVIFRNFTPILKATAFEEPGRSGAAGSIQTFRGFDAEATATIMRNGTPFVLTKTKTLVVDQCVLGGCARPPCVGPGCPPPPPNFIPTRCVHAPFIGRKAPRQPVSASVTVYGPAVKLNVMTSSNEVASGRSNAQPRAILVGNQLISPNLSQASAAIAFTRFTSSNNHPNPNRRNDILLTNHDWNNPNGTPYSYEFEAPSPLTAVDNAGTVPYPIYATVQRPDGSWTRCDAAVTVQVQQIGSCHFFGVNGNDAIDNSGPVVDLAASIASFEQFAATLHQKGYKVPGCSEGCSNYGSASECTSGLRNRDCYWFSGPGVPNGQCFYRDLTVRKIQCDRDQFLASQTAGELTVGGTVPTVTRPASNLPSSVTVNWKRGENTPQACASMRVYLVPAINSDSTRGNRPQYFYRTTAGQLEPIPTTFIDPDDVNRIGAEGRDFFVGPPKEDIYDFTGKLIGHMPRIVGGVSCTDTQFQVSVAHSQYVPRQRYTVVGNYRVNSQESFQCIQNVWAGADPCSYTNATKKVGSVNVAYGNSGERSTTWTFQPATMVETAAVANTPTDTTDCRGLTDPERCFFLPMTAGQYLNRTPFIRVANPDLSVPNTSECRLIRVNRIALGCFLKGSKILMADGLWREGHLVSIGDYVWNPVSKMAAKVIDTTYGPERQDLIVITTKESVIRVTGNHPMPTLNGLKAAKDILPSDAIKRIDGGFSEIIKLGREPSLDRDVWNVRLEGSGKEEDMHYVLVDGVVAGDLTLQEQLETKLRVTKADGE